MRLATFSIIFAIGWARSPGEILHDLERRLLMLESDVEQQKSVTYQQTIVIEQQTLQIQELETELANIEEQQTNQNNSIKNLTATSNNLETDVAELDDRANQPDYFFNYKLSDSYV